MWRKLNICPSDSEPGSDIILNFSLLPDQGVVLTADTDSFIIGQRVWVGGLRPGHIAYIGETHFAPGDWAGVVLDEPNGKNDGSISGKRYFQCEAKKGVFSRLTRLTREPLPGAGAISAGGSGDTSLDQSLRSLTSPMRSGAVSPTHSVSSFASRSPAMGSEYFGVLENSPNVHIFESNLQKPLR